MARMSSTVIGRTPRIWGVAMDVFSRFIARPAPDKMPPLRGLEPRPHVSSFRRLLADLKPTREQFDRGGPSPATMHPM